jgi:starch phosphorylase
LDAPAFGRLFQAQAPDWGHDPDKLDAADQLPDEAVWAAHAEAKGDLLAEIERRTGIRMRLDLPLIAFARRMTGYKRPDLLFADVERLRAIHRAQPFQVVMAGKAHPRDDSGKALIRQIHDHMRRLRADIPMAFLPNYDMRLARVMVAGADVWLNTPLPPLEASGTSGMKAALNGVLNLSVLDGWWLEAWIEGVTGWAVGQDGAGDGDHARHLYDKLEGTVLPLYHGDRARWIWMMKETISKIGPRFNSQRMMRRYASEAYLR